MNILGISAFYHDAAAALLIDGRLVAAAQEERFTRVKHDARFPERAIAYCLEEGGIAHEELDYVVFYEKPLMKFERLLETYLAYAPRGFRSFRRALPLWVQQKLFLRREIRRGLNGRYAGPLVFPSHHESHAASAFFPSPFEKAAILTVDGVGEWETTTVGRGEGYEIRLLESLTFPHSLGLLYSAFTYHAGFRVTSGEYKLMGLAPFGEPKYVDLIKERLIDIKPDGSFRLDLDYFNYCHGLTMTNAKFDGLFGRRPRRGGEEIDTVHMDMAASVQKVTEEIMLALARHAYEASGCDKLCLAGGVALNCVANGRILREGPFKELWVQPAAGDAGGAVGAAMMVWYQLLQNPRDPRRPDGQMGSLLGPAFSDDEIGRILREREAVFHFIEDETRLAERVAALLAEGKVVGFHQGRMEFGPRALGCRSILADPRSPAMQRRLNRKIKFRESFRPFAPSVLLEHAHAYFEMRPGEESPYMLLVSDVAASQRRGNDGAVESARGFEKLQVPISTIPAVTHVDGSARVQTVDRERNRFFRAIVEAFHRETGVPLVVNTSLNVRGEPIVCTPDETFRCFMATEMDALVLGHHFLMKEEQKEEKAGRREAYLGRYGED